MELKSIGKLGVWMFFDGFAVAETVQFVQELEQLGVAAVWVPEAAGRDPFTHLAVLAAHTESIRLATGIANIYARGAVAMRAACTTLQEASNGRFILGLGVSHPEGVGPVWGREYGRPVATMRSFVSDLLNSPYRAPQPAVAAPLVLAALRPNMLGLACEVAAGAHPYFTPPEHTARARDILGPEMWLAPEQAVVRETDPATARGAARAYMRTYLRLANYRNNLKTLGFADDDFEGGGSNRLVDAVVAWGDERAIYRRLEQHWSAGADHVSVQTLALSGAASLDLTLFRAITQ